MRYPLSSVSLNWESFSLNSNSETESFKVKKIELSDLKPEFKSNVQEMINEYNKKWTQPQIEAKIIELSGSFAWVMPLFDAKKKTAQINQQDTAVPRTRVVKYSSITSEAFFKTNSANLDEPVVGDTPTDSIMQQYGLKSRDMLELSLATNRAFFTSSDASMVTVGFTSPEQPVCANQVLSELRAKAVEQAVKDALGPNLKIKTDRIKSCGKGETLAISAGLQDPEASGLTREQFIQKFPKEVAEWPFYRRVDLFVDDVIVASVKG
jgi:outer membrane protein OmpA-like peptidoglycan-associated protein